ncbi:hypothetical protein J6590_058721 [Homalodisca vitripennis]|nr:hypothetical protein J6590_058721 [Homalodisca vitripennis]
MTTNQTYQSQSPVPNHVIQTRQIDRLTGRRRSRRVVFSQFDKRCHVRPRHYEL